MGAPAPHASWRAALLLGLFAVAYVLWVHPLVGRPLLADEAGFAEGAGWRFFQVAPPRYHQPPLFRDLLEICSEEFHWRLAELRWIGVSCFLVQLLLVYLIAQRLQPRAGGLAAFLWLTHPMAIQGSLILDIDNTILAVILSAWCLLFLELRWPSRWRECALLGLLMGLGLWAKASTPLGLPVLVLFYGLTRRQPRAAVTAAIGVGVWGILVFAVVWVCYQTLRLEHPENLILRENLWGMTHALRGTSMLSVGRELVARLPRLFLWMNPVLVLMGGLAWWAGRRQRVAFPQDKSALCWWYVITLGVGYWLVRGPHYGFAKYHYPLLPILLALVSAVCVAAGYPTRRRHWWLVLGASAAVGAIAYWLIGDMFFTMGQLRTSFLVTPTETSALLHHLAAQLAGAALLMLAVWCAVRWRMRGAKHSAIALVTFLIVLLGMHGATNVRQRTTEYSTTYTYGRSLSDMRAMMVWLMAEDARAPRNFWLAPSDLLIPVRVRRYPLATYWTDADVLARALRDPRVRGLILSPATNTQQTYHQVLPDPRVQAVLQQQFERFQQGEYTVWVRGVARP